MSHVLFKCSTKGLVLFRHKVFVMDGEWEISLLNAGELPANSPLENLLYSFYGLGKIFRYFFIADIHCFNIG